MGGGSAWLESSEGCGGADLEQGQRALGDGGHGTVGRSLPLCGACCSLSLRAKEGGCPLLLATASGRAPGLGVIFTPWGCCR